MTAKAASAAQLALPYTAVIAGNLKASTPSYTGYQNYSPAMADTSCTFCLVHRRCLKLAALRMSKHACAALRMGASKHWLQSVLAPTGTHCTVHR
jgi:hypothetical protein